MYSSPATLTGINWSPNKSKHVPPKGDPTMESSLMVTAIGAELEMYVPPG